MEAKDFARAHDEFRTAVNFLPDALTTADQHDQAVEGFCDSGVKLAEQRIAEGKYAEAEQIVREVVSDRYDPNCREALNLLAHLSEPGYFNKTMGPKFIAKVEEVKKLLSDADGYYNSGRYDLAFKKYEQVLNLDPYNVAARRGEERIDLTKTHYGQEAYNETRSRQLWQVQKGLGRTGPAIWPDRRSDQRCLRARRGRDGADHEQAQQHHHSQDRVSRRQHSRGDRFSAAASGRQRSLDGRKKGVDIVLRTTSLGKAEAPAPLPETAPPLPGASPEAAIEPTPVPSPAAPSIAPADARITITLNQIPLGEALRYIASQAGLKVKVEPYAVSIIPINEQSNDLFTKEYRVPPGFISSSVNVGANALNQPAKTGQTTGTGKDTQESTGGQQLVNRQTALDFLKDQGVPFPPGASANFLPQSSRLIVRNTEENLELVDALVEQANVAGPKQVEIEAKFVEITQNNLKELGFDWLLGAL